MINNQPLDTADLFNSGSYFSLRNWRYFFCTFALFSLSPFLPFFAPATQASIYWANRQEGGVECEPHRTGKRHFSALCPIVSVPHPSLCFMLTLLARKIMQNNNTVMPVMQAPFLSKQAVKIKMYLSCPYSL